MQKHDDGASPTSADARPQQWATYGFHWLKVGGIALGMAALVAASVGMIVLDLGGTVGQIVLGLCAGFFVLILLYVSADLSIRGPVVVIDCAGIWDKRLSPAPIPWGEIEETYLTGVSGQVFIGLEVRQPNRHLPSRYTPRGLLLRLNPRFGYPALTLGTSALRANPVEVLATIERFRAQAASSGSSSSGR